MRATRINAGRAAIVAAALLLLAGVAGCGGDSETAEPTTETTATDTLPTEPATQTTETETQATETTETTETTQSRPAVTVMRIRIRDGKAVGGIQRTTVTKGDRVRIVVTSDVTDEVHLHGYDLAADVSPAGRGVIVFKATIPGRFEIELEDRGLQIGELEVRP